MLRVFEPGDLVKAKGEQGRFKVMVIRKDGDIDVYGGLGGGRGIKETTGLAQWRTFKASQLTKVKK